MGNNPEIILEAQEIHSILSVDGPFSEEMFADKRRKVLRVVTPETPSAEAESHEQYNDIFFIIEGEREIFIGGEIADKRQNIVNGELQPGEWRGKKVNDVPGNEIRKYRIKAGDIVIIPKGVVHYYGFGVVKMLVIKTS